MKTFLDRIPDYRSVAFVGMAKNVGKTETLNRVLEMFHGRGIIPAVTSIGTDGESVDAVTRTRKPEISLSEGTIFVTSESYYRRRKLTAEILEVGRRATSLGRLVTARVVSRGKVILSGPPDTSGLLELLGEMDRLDVRTTLVDGALSRLSLGSPAITDALVLSTGAALSASMQTVAERTAFVCEMMRLPVYEKRKLKTVTADGRSLELAELPAGVYGIDEEADGVTDLKIATALAITSHREQLLDYRTLFISGAVTDRMMQFLGTLPCADQLTIVIKDFACMFAEPRTYRILTARGVRVRTLRCANILGITVNPLSPTGIRFDSDQFCSLLTTLTGLPAIDVMRLKA